MKCALCLLFYFEDELSLGKNWHVWYIHQKFIDRGNRNIINLVLKIVIISLILNVVVKIHKISEHCAKAQKLSRFT